MFRLILTSLSLISTGLLLAQQEGNIWYFGQQAGLDFNSGAAVAVPGGAMDTFEGCATICDEDGNLLFYSNGGGRLPAVGQSTGIIWNRNDDVMYDMQGAQGGGFSSAQSSVIIPKPGAENVYYLFTMEEVEYNIDGNIPGQDLGRGLSYFEVDMNLNGQLGDVTIADVRVFVAAYESLAAALHENEEDYWIITVDFVTKEFVPFLVSSGGVQPQTSIPSDPNNPPHGVIKISPDRSWLHCAGALYNFDSATGSISNPLALPFDNFAAFSPNSRYLYLIGETGTGNSILQFDLESPDPLATQTNIADLGQGVVAQMQVAPDGNIYFINNDFGSLEVNLSVITCANSPAASVTQNVFSFLGEESPFFGLPNFADHIFAREDEPLTVDLGPDSLSLCGLDSLLLDAGNPGGSYLWSTGAVTRTISVGAPGTYAVTVTKNCQEGVDTVVVRDAGEPLVLTIAGDSVLCPGAVVTLTVFPDTLSSYLWSNGATTASITVSDPGAYGVIADGACLQGTASQTVTLFESPGELAIQGDSLFCVGSSVRLAIDPAFLDPVWSTGETGPEIQIEEPGTYTVTAGTLCSQTPLVTSIQVEEEAPPVELTVDGPERLCEGAPVELSAAATGATVLQWSTGETGESITVGQGGAYTVTASNLCGQISTEIFLEERGLPVVRLEGDSIACLENPVILSVEGENIETLQWSTGESGDRIQVRQTGRYTATAFNECGTASDERRVEIVDCRSCIYLPNAFSPNNDGINDRFRPEVVCELTDYQLRIFSRWGELVFETSQPGEGWDGLIRGTEAPAGVFTYTLAYRLELAGEDRLDSGELYLLR